MEITVANIGDVICIDQKARCILVENVTDKFVHYRQETGDRYATAEHEIAGSVVRDPKVVSEFYRNAKLGSALGHAEFSAFRKILDGSLEPAQREEAGAVLSIVKSMQKHLEERVASRQPEQVPVQHASLEDMIRKANADRQASGSRETKRTAEKENSTVR